MSSRVLHNAAKRIGIFSDSASSLPLASVLVVSFVVIVPAILWGIPSNLDLSNHFRFALPFHDAIAAGDLYPGWLAESNDGYGDPSFRFYPPALYYLLAGSRMLVGNWFGATLLAYTLLSLAAGLAMYFWTRSFLPSSTAAWASIFYALAPYHINQLYQAVMLAEWAGSAILPFVFGFVERVCEKGKPRDIAGLAVTYGLLVFTHLPLAVIGSIALLVYAFVRVEGTGKIRKLAKLSFAAALGLSISAIYWVTMISEMRWIGLNEAKPDPSVEYSYNFIFSTLSPDNLSVWWMNILVVMTLLLCAPALLFFFRGAAPLRRVTRPVMVLTAFALFMSLPLSWPIWRVLKPLQETQFPWRWLAVFSMGASIIAAAALPLITGSAVKLDRPKRILVFGAMAIAVAFTLSHSVREAQYLSPSRFETALTDVRGTSSINYWVPIWANANPREMNTEVEVAAREVTVTSWQAEHRKFSVSAGPATEARVKTFYYPHWTATSEARVLSTRPDTDGALLISLPPGATSVDLGFREPRRTKFSTMVSLSGLMIIGGLVLPFKGRRSNRIPPAVRSSSRLS